MYDVPEVQNSYEIINMRGTVRMKIRDILAKNEPTLSFEVFPPKTEDKYESVEMAASEIAKLNPAFMSVTYGAGGGTSQYTVDIAASLKAKGVTPLAHLTCVSSTREKVHSVPGVVEDKIRLHLIGRLMEKLCVLFYFA